MAELTFTLAPIPPFRLDLTAWALRRRASNALDRWDGTAYRRVLILDGRPLDLTVRMAHTPGGSTLALSEAKSVLEVTVHGERLPAEVRPPVAAVLERLLGLDVDLAGFYRLAASDPVLAPLAARFRGLKPPRYATLFECLVNAIACQQVTLTLGIRLLNRLAGHLGRPVPEPDGEARAFPGPEELAAAGPELLRGLGFSRQKAQALLELAATVLRGELDYDGLASLDDAATVARLRELRGVGRWTAEYALLRGLGRLHIFPGDDVGARNRLATWLGIAGPLDYTGVARLLDRWQPYAGLLYFHLLLLGLAEQGSVA